MLSSCLSAVLAGRQVCCGAPKLHQSGQNAEPGGAPLLAMSVGGHEGADGTVAPGPWDGYDSHTMG